MGWQPVPAEHVDPEAAESAAVQAGMFLTEAIRSEVDGAQIDPIQVLMDPQRSDHAIYAVTAVSGPLRNYLATAWGRAGHVAGKQIVAHGTIEESRQAAVECVAKHTLGDGTARRYVVIGTFSS